MLKCSNISFCDKQAFNIIDDNIKKKILDILKNDYFITIKDKNFYIINKKNINYIEKNPYIISVKSIGSLYYLFLTKIDNKNYCFFIDKKIKDGHEYPRILSVLYRFDDVLFNNTLFEGELLRDNDNKWLFVINNLILYKNQILKNKNIIYKLNIVYDILNNYYIKDDHLEICPLYVKRLFSNHEWDKIVNDYIPNLNYKTRGLYFENTKSNKNYLFIFPRTLNLHNKTISHNSNKNNNSCSNINNNNSYSNSNKSDNSYSNINNSNSNKSDNSYSNINNSNSNKSDNSYSNINNSNSNKSDKKGTIIKKNMNFVLIKTDISDIYDLYCLKDNELYKYDIALINSLKTSKKLNKLFKSESRLKFYCEYDNIKNKWIPIENNNDKIDQYSTIKNHIN